MSDAFFEPNFKFQLTSEACLDIFVEIIKLRLWQPLPKIEIPFNPFPSFILCTHVPEFGILKSADCCCRRCVLSF